MHQQQTIIEKQNEDRMLKFQYTARHYFNKAEVTGYIALVLSLFSAFCIFLPESHNISVIAPLIIDGLFLVSQKIASSDLKKAALLRNYYDSYVLGIPNESYIDDTIRNMNEIVTKLTLRYPKSCQEQISHSGHDDPPGVKNWYEFSRNFPDNEAVLECQKQNCWWTDKLSFMRIWLTIIPLLIILVLCGICLFLYGIPLINTFACYATLLYGSIDLVISNVQYFLISRDLKTIKAVPHIADNPEALSHLQEKINQRRELQVLEINAIHKRFAKSWSELYAETSKR